MNDTRNGNGRRLRAVLYGRLSSDRRGEGRSVDGQLDFLQKTAKTEHWTVAAEHRDDDVGASTYSKGEREGWPQVLALIESGHVDVLAVWALSRATRDRIPYATLVSACVANRVRLNLGGRYVDPADPDEAFTLDVEAAFAVREAGKISKDIKRGHAWSATEGRPHGAHGWPFERVYEGTPPRLVEVKLIPERAELLRAAALGVLAGDTLTAWAKKINAAGVDPDREWSGRTLRRNLLSPTTAGLRVHQGRVVGSAMWPSALATGEPGTEGYDDGLEIHRKLVKLLDDPKRRTTTDNQVRWLLSRLALCGICGAWMKRVAGTKRPARLTCSAVTHLSMLQEPAERYAEEVLIARLQRPDALDAWRPDPASASNTVASANAKLAKLRRQLDEWEDAATEGTVTPQAFGRIEAKLNAKIADLEAETEAAAVEVPEVLREVTEGDVPANWARLSTKAKRDVAKLIGAPTILPGRAPVQERVKFPWELG